MPYIHPFNGVFGLYVERRIRIIGRCWIRYAEVLRFMLNQAQEVHLLAS